MYIPRNVMNFRYRIPCTAHTHYLYQQLIIILAYTAEQS